MCVSNVFHVLGLFLVPPCLPSLPSPCPTSHPTPKPLRQEKHTPLAHFSCLKVVQPFPGSRTWKTPLAHFSCSAGSPPPNTKNVPAVAHSSYWGEANQLNTKMCPYVGAFSCLAGFPPHCASPAAPLHLLCIPTWKRTPMDTFSFGLPPLQPNLFL